MKRFFYAALLLGAATFGLSACNNGLYDADVTTTNNGSNPLNPGGGTGGTGGGGGGTAADFPWGGTDPVSAKVDGNMQVFETDVVFTMMGTIGITAQQTATGNAMSVQIPEGATPGVYPMNASYTASYSENTSNVYGAGIPGGTPGKILVEVNDATTLKGKFYFTGADPIGGGKRVITEGYFNVTK